MVPASWLGHLSVGLAKRKRKACFDNCFVIMLPSKKVNMNKNIFESFFTGRVSVNEQMKD